MRGSKCDFAWKLHQLPVTAMGAQWSIHLPLAATSYSYLTKNHQSVHWTRKTAYRQSQLLKRQAWRTDPRKCRGLASSYVFIAENKLSSPHFGCSSMVPSQSCRAHIVPVKVLLLRAGTREPVHVNGLLYLQIGKGDLHAALLLWLVDSFWVDRLFGTSFCVEATVESSRPIGL